MSEIVSWFGNNIVIIALVATLIAVLLIRYTYERYALLVLLSLVSLPISLVLKNVFKTQRPTGYNESYLFDATRYGFPSGHVLFYVAFFGFLIYVSLKSKKLPATVRILVTTIATIHIVFVGASRINLLAHGFIDVLGGYLIGAGILTTLVLIDKLWEKK